MSFLKIVYENIEISKFTYNSDDWKVWGIEISIFDIVIVLRNLLYNGFGTCRLYEVENYIICRYLGDKFVLPKYNYLKWSGSFDIL